MDNNGKDTKHTMHISRRVNFISNGGKCKMHKIEWCEGGLKLAYIATKNVITEREQLYKRVDRLQDSTWRKSYV